MRRYEYTHGGDIYDETGAAREGIIDFSANINPLGMPDGVAEAARLAVDESGRYPDPFCRSLCRALAGFEGTGGADILCSGGASDIIFRTALALRPERVMVTAPSFADYERAGRAAGAEILHHRLSRESGFEISADMAVDIREREPGLVFVCNPNNPGGRLTDRGTIAAIARACLEVGAVLVVDECFLELALDSDKYTAKPLLGEYRNLVVLKAFTKSFALPGLRLGYAVSENTELLDRLRLCGADWPVSNVAQAAGLAALSGGREFLLKSAGYIAAERERLARELSGLGLTVFPSGASFLLLRCEEGLDLKRRLLERGYLIRDCSGYAGLEAGYYRVAVLTREKNSGLIEAMRGALQWQG